MPGARFQYPGMMSPHIPYLDPPEPPPPPPPPAQVILVSGIPPTYTPLPSGED